MLRFFLSLATIVPTATAVSLGASSFNMATTTKNETFDLQLNDRCPALPLDPAFSLAGTTVFVTASGVGGLRQAASEVFNALRTDFVALLNAELLGGAPSGGAPGGAEVTKQCTTKCALKLKVSRGQGVVELKVRLYERVSLGDIAVQFQPRLYGEDPFLFQRIFEKGEVFLRELMGAKNVTRYRAGVTLPAKRQFVAGDDAATATATANDAPPPPPPPM